MLFSLWLMIPVFFWMGYSFITKGHFVRHIGFLHYLLYFLSIYFGSYTIFMEGGETNLKFIFSVMAYPVLSLSGIIIGLQRSKKVFFKNEVAGFETTSKEIKIVVVSALFILAVLSLYLFLLGENIPLLVAFRGSREEGHVARYIATKGYQDLVGGIGALVWIPRILIDYFGLFILVLVYCHTRKRPSGIIMLLSLLIVLSFICLLFNEKYPILKLIFCFGFAVYSINYPQIRLKAIAICIFGLISFVFAMGLTAMVVLGDLPRVYGEGISPMISTIMKEGWTSFLSRVLQGQCTPLYQIFNILPSEYDFFMGRTLTNPHGIFPYDQIVLPHLVYSSYLKSIPGVQGSDPTVFFGEIYANFGLAISWLSMFLMGYIIQFINSKVSTKIQATESFYYIAYFYMLMVYIGDFSIGFSTLYFDERLYFLILLFFLPMIRIKNPSVNKAH
jgi:hypothetical protein